MSAPHQHDARCQELFARLSEYIDGELPANTCAEIEAHFAGCPPCLQFLANFKDSIRLTREWRADEHLTPITQEAKAAFEDAWRQSAGRRS